MKPSLIGTGLLLLLFGAVAPTYARQEQTKPERQEQAKAPRQEQAKPERQQETKAPRQEQAKPERQQQAKAPRQEQAKPERQQQAKAPRQEEAKPERQQQAKAPRQEQAKGQQEQHANRPSQQAKHGHPAEQQAAWQGHRARNWQSEHRDWQQRGGYHGYRIPDDRYREHFGRDHWFHIYSYPVVVVGGYPRFQYGGFWFSIVDPWPENWTADWYDNDDVYIDYSGDGYYMYDRRYPGVGLAISVSVN